MSDSDGMAIPLPDEGAVGGRRRAYELRQLLDRVAQFDVLALLKSESLLYWLVGVLSGSMMVFPFYIFFQHLRLGELFISPPLFFMFLAGVTGCILPPPEERDYDLRERGS